MSVTIKDIANLAGVSKTTVSKVINNKDESISKATKDKILKIMKEQNYVPNKLAQGLVTKRTKTIGLLIPDIRNPFFTDISRGAEDYARKEGYNIIFCSTDEDYEREVECIEMICEKMVDGIIFAPSSNTSNKDDRYKNLNTPMVLVDKNLDISNSKGLVKVDNKNGTYEATKHLINKGHKEILYLSGPLKNDITRDRLNGYLRALEKNNVNLNEDYIVEGKYKYEWSYEFIKNMKEINYTAICCANDLMAIGAIQALRERGLNVPNDISVVGFDDIQTAKLIDPSLTTVRQPAYEMGEKASEILIDYLKNKDKDSVGTITFKPELIVRNSTKSIE
nr:LacI family DNA-binding transcriptional regulator [[Clostridium] dakarense]